MRITPSANRNTYSVATLIIHIPRVEALRTSTLGYEIATPTELPGVRTIQHRSPIPVFLKEEREPHNHLKHSKKELQPLEKGYYCELLQLPYMTKGKWRITQKDLQLFRASPHAPEWSGNIHESKLSDIRRPTQSRLPIGRLKSYKCKKSAYGGKKSPARAGKKEISHRCYALHDNQEYTGSCFCTGESRTFLNGRRPLFLPSWRMASCTA